MPNNRRQHTAFFTLGTFCALIYIANYVAHIVSRFSYPLMLLASAWVVAFVLKPVAQWLDQGVVPDTLTDWVRRRWGDRYADLLRAARIPYGLAVTMIYFSLLLSLVMIVLLLSPPLINQLTRLSKQLPEYAERIPSWWAGVQDEIVRRFGVDREVLTDLVSMDDLTQQVTEVLPDVLQGGIAVVQGIASGIANTLLVLTLSLYLMLDSRRLAEQLNRVLPLSYQDDFEFINRTVRHAFGSFLLGKVVKGAIHAGFVMLVMSLFNLPFKVVTATFTGLLMFIPQLGMPVAMVAPSLISMMHGSDATIPVLIVMAFFQQVLIRFIMPKLTSEWTGMPPLLSMLAVIVGSIVLGAWGFFFSAPAATAIYIISVTVLERKKQAADARDKELSGN